MMFCRVVALWLIVILINSDMVGDGSSVVCVQSNLMSFWLVWVGPEHQMNTFFASQMCVSVLLLSFVTVV